MASDEYRLVPDFRLVVDGQAADAELMGSVIGIRCADDLDRAARFQIHLSDSARKWTRTDRFKPGTEVEIKLGYQGQLATVCKAVVQSLEVVLTPDGPARLLVAGLDKGHAFARGTVTKTYQDVKDSDLAQQIAQRNGLTADVDDSGVVHEYVFQNNLSDYDFLLQRATLAGFRFQVDGSKLSFKKPRVSQQAAAKLTWRENIGRLAVEVNTYDQITKFSIAGWDPKQRKDMTSPGKGGDEYGKQGGQITGADLVKQRFGDVEAVIPLASGQQNLLEARAKSEFNKRAGSFVTAEGRVTGDPNIRAGAVVQLEKAAKRIDGEYYVVSSEHLFFVDTGYATEFRARRYTIQKKSPAARPASGPPSKPTSQGQAPAAAQQQQAPAAQQQQQQAQQQQAQQQQAQQQQPAPAPQQQQAQQQAQQQPATGNLAIKVVDAGGQAIANAQVVVKDSAGATAGSGATASPGGDLTIQSLEEASYSVEVSADGFVPQSATAKVQANQTVPVQVKLSPQALVIQKVDDQFAPGAESLSITYDIQGLSAAPVKLQVLADNYAGGKLFERDLTAAEKADGNGKTLEWDGSIDNGARKARHATPLLSPFKVVLFHSAAKKSEKPFKVLYHSIALVWGKHTPSGVLPPTTEREKYAQARLDELGYDAGPVTGAIGATAKGALRRFQRANYKTGTTTLLQETGNLDDDTFAALRAATAREIWEPGKDALAGDAKFYVYDDFYSDRGGDFVAMAQSGPEFSSADRKTHAEDKMERAFLPLEVEVKLVGKGGGAVSAPDAVGPVTVAWEVSDAPEDATVIPAGDNALAHTYVERARQFGTAAGSVASAARIDQDGDDAPASLDGIRDPDPAKYVKAWFPDDAGSKLEPFAVRGYGSETRGGASFHRALVDAWDHATDHPDRKGRAGAYFRFSIKGGDDAKIRAALSFDGLPNKAQLEGDHAASAADLVKETGRWTVWRRSHLNAYCQQAAPTRKIGTPDWATIRDRWKQAFIEIDNAGRPMSVLDYATIVPEATFKAAILAMPVHKPPSATDAAHIHYSPTQMYAGPPMRPQHPAETAQQYVEQCQQTMTAWVEHPIDAILGVIHDHVRKTEAEGFIIFDFRIHDPISGQDWDPSLNGGSGGFKPTSDPAARNRTSQLAGYVRLDGAVTMCVDNPFNVNCYVMHECGHARFLYHHLTHGGGAHDTSDTPDDHDHDQERCIMSYGISPDGPDDWDYRFCGKCILRLRGWNVRPLPHRYTP